MRYGAAVLVVLAACKSEGSSGVTLERSKDGPAVVEVTGSAQLDLAAAKEVEPNNSRDEATALELPVAVSGVLASVEDLDFYEIEAPRTGALVVTVDEVDDLDIALALHDQGGEVIAKADRGPEKTGEGFPNYPVKKGQTLYVAVTEYVDSRRKRRKKRKREGKGDEDEPERPRYRLEARMLEGAPDELEREPNSEVSQAARVLLGDRPTGYVGWSKDVDLWKLSLQGFGENNLIDLSVEGIDGIELELELESADGKQVLRRTAPKSGSIYVRGLSVTDSPHLIARISGDRSHERQRYRMEFGTRHRDEGSESEPNNTGKQATELTGEAAGGGTGHLTNDDVDYFTIEPVDEPVTLTIAVEGPAAVTFDLAAWAGGKKLGDTAGRAKVELFGLPLSAGQRVRFRIKADGVTGDPAGYTITWMHGPAVTEEPDPTDPTDPFAPSDGDPSELLE